jgi:hypothetical protein
VMRRRKRAGTFCLPELLRRGQHRAESGYDINFDVVHLWSSP